MAITKWTENGLAVYKEDTITGPTAGATVYSGVIKEFRPNHDTKNRWVTISAIGSAAKTGTVNVRLYGSHTLTGTKTLLKTDLVASTDSTLASALVDLNAYPAPYYWIAIHSTGEESDITYTVYMCG